MEHADGVITGHPSNDWQHRSTRELIRAVASKASLLVQKEIELARTELAHDTAAERSTLKSFAIAAVAAIMTLNLLLMAAVLALTPFMAGWLAALVAGGVAWRRHVRRPLDRTRKTLEEDVRWMKEELV